MSSVRSSLLLGLAVVLTACATTTGGASSTPASSCPPSGTEVSFAKIMNPGFAEDYVGCSVTTKAAFVATGAGAWTFPFSTDDKVIIRVLPPGVAGSKNPLSGEVQANYVALPKEGSDAVFNLKPGDLVELTGGTYVKDYGNFKNITFMATSIAPANQ